MHLISATLTEAAYEIRAGWPSRQKSAHISKAIIFYYENGPSNLEGLWQKVQTRERYLRELESEVKRYRETFGTFNPTAGLEKLTQDE